MERTVKGPKTNEYRTEPEPRPNTLCYISSHVRTRISVAGEINLQFPRDTFLRVYGPRLRIGL